MTGLLVKILRSTVSAVFALFVLINFGFTDFIILMAAGGFWLFFSGMAFVFAGVLGAFFIFRFIKNHLLLNI